MARMDRPLQMRAYPRIPHLPGSGAQSDDLLSDDRAAQRFFRPHLDRRVYIQEKLDGTCVAVARQGHRLLALGKEGDRLEHSRSPGRRVFAAWVAGQEARFLDLLADGERVVGEWLLVAHATRYCLKHEAFVPFDLISGNQRQPWHRTQSRLEAAGFQPPALIYAGPPIALEEALPKLGQGQHGALEQPEGLIWRLEEAGQPKALAKYVHPDKKPGIYLSDHSGLPAVYNLHQRQHPDRYEAHISIRPRHAQDFEAWCQSRSIKTVDIRLDRADPHQGGQQIQPMTAQALPGPFGAALSETWGMVLQMEEAGFDVVRVKLEAWPENIEQPVIKGGYYEYHLKLCIEDDQALQHLRQACQPYQAHLSQNALGQDARYRFVTLRVDAAKSEADAKSQLLQDLLKDLGHTPIKYIREYTVYDSNRALDAGWLDAAP